MAILSSQLVGTFGEVLACILEMGELVQFVGYKKRPTLVGSREASVPFYHRHLKGTRIYVLKHYARTKDECQTCLVLPQVSSF